MLKILRSDVHVMVLWCALPLLAASCSDSPTAADAAVDGPAPDLAQADTSGPDGTSPDQGQPDQASPTDSAVDAQGSDTSAGTWQVPGCKSITGQAAITFTHDGGKTLAPFVNTFTGVKYTFGLVTLAKANTLVAQHENELWRTTNGGCSWASLGQSPGLLRLVAQGNTVYGWSDNNAHLVQIVGTTVKNRTAPVKAIHGLGVSKSNSRHLRIGGPGGQIHASSDGGSLWTKQGTSAASPGSDYRVAFDPQDVDHAVYGRSVDGAFVTFDGGKTWTKATGLSSGSKPKANIFELAISPADGQIVWAMGIDLTMPKTTRQIFRSSDGGRTFTPVVQESGTVPMSNGTQLWPHPKRAYQVFFAHGSKFSGGILMTYDHKTGKVTGEKNSYHGINAIAVSPADDDLLYLGLTLQNYN